MALKFFHLPKPRKFAITPRYYDPAEEERLERENRIRQELGMPLTSDPHDPTKPYRPSLRGQFRQAMKRGSRTTPGERRKSNNRLFLIIAILAFLVYLLFYR